MKHFQLSPFSVFPLLAILTSSPATLQTKYGEGRSLASVEEKKSQHPKFDQIVSKIDQSSLNKEQDLTPDKLIVKLTADQERITKELKDFSMDQCDKNFVKKQREDIEKNVTEILLLELEHNLLLNEKKISSHLSQEVLNSIGILKSKTEDLIAKLEANEELVAKEDSKNQPSVVVEKPKSEEAKSELNVEEKKEEVKNEICEADEKIKVLTGQVETLIKQQNDIMRQLMGMTQQMVGFLQQQTLYTNQYFSGAGNLPTPYVYTNPYQQGTWLYYPSGFQPGQTNIFNGSPFGGYPQETPKQQQGSFYPDQLHQGPQPQGQWGLQPSYQFRQESQFSLPQSISPGSFGGADGFSFNFSHSGPSFLRS